MRRFAPDARCRGGGLSVDRLASGRGSRTNSNTSRQVPARVIDAAYDIRLLRRNARATTEPPCRRPVPSEKVRLWLAAPHTGEIRPRNRSTSEHIILQ